MMADFFKLQAPEEKGAVSGRVRVCVIAALTAILFFAPNIDPVRAEVSLADQQDSFYWYQEAKYLAVNRKNYEKAMEQCEKALKLNPDNQHAIALRDWLRERLTQIAEIKKRKDELANPKKSETTSEVIARPEFTPPPSTPPAGETDDINYFQGLKKLTEGRFEEANEFFKADIVENPDRIESWFYLFKYSKDNGNEKGALYFLKKLQEKIRAKGPGGIPAELAETVKNQCHLYQDEAILQKGIYKHNLDIDIKNEIKSGFDWSAISLVPQTSDVLITKKIMTMVDVPKLKAAGVIPRNFKTPGENFKMDMNGRVYAAVQSFKRKPVVEIPALAGDVMAQKTRSDVESLISQGDYYAFISLYDRAETYYDEALSRAPESAVANNNKGVVLKAKGKFDAAIGYFKKAIAYDKTYVEAYNNLATIYSDRGNFEEALKLFLIALKLNPNEAGLFYNVGVLYNKLGKPDDAREYIIKAIDMNSADPSYYYQLAQIYLKKGNRKLAYDNFRRVSLMVPKGSDIYLKVVEIIRTIDPDN